MRLRFAPSPTGFLHIGNARTAIINYLLSRKYNATFILRIEDTDRERSSKESEDSIMEDLRWLGLEWDEGPEIGGDFGPYRQSERYDIYNTYTQKLIENGYAYPCYCSQEELEVMRTEAEAEKRNAVYTGRCRNLTPEQRAEFEKQGKKPAIRFKVPENQIIEISDHIRGTVTFNSDNIGGDFIIVRSDGNPVYNYIVIIDDALMGVTDVVRGEDHLSNTPKQILIAQALDLDVPSFAHLPLVLGPDRSKLSKRHGITSVDLYRKQGYLPEALVNYIAMLGWASDTGEEILLSDEIIRQIDINNLAKSAAVFDFQKLKWMNGQYIKSAPISEITEKFMPYLKEARKDIYEIQPEVIEQMIDTLRGNCEVLADINGWIGIYLDDQPLHDSEVTELLKTDEGKQVITAARDIMNDKLNESNYCEGLVAAIKEITGLKGKMLFHPIRAIITGRLKGPDLNLALPLIGFSRCKIRIDNCYSTYCN